MNAMSSSRYAGIAIWIMVTLIFSSASRAVDYTWKGPGNIWSAAGNWDPGDGPPKTVTDTATIGTASPTTVNVDINVTLDTFTLNSGAKVVQANGRSMSAKNGFQIQAGRLAITDSTLTSSDNSVQLLTGSAGLTVSGISSISTKSTVFNKGTITVTGTATDGARLTLGASGLNNQNIVQLISNADGKQTILDLTADTGFVDLSNTGTVTFQGTAGSIKVVGRMYNWPDSKMEVKRNTTFEDKTDRSHVNYGSININKNSILTLIGKSFTNGVLFKGTIQGNGTLDARQLTGIDPNEKGIINSGFLKPGDSPGILTIDGHLTQEDPGSLEIELGGTTIDTVSGNTEYDRLVVTGQSLLGGELHVSLIDSFLAQPPSPNDVFDILTSDGGLTGFFTNASSQVYTTDGLGRFDVTYIYGAGSPGDPGIVRLSNFIAIPEPGAGSLTLFGLSYAILRRRTRTRGENRCN